MLKVKTFEGGGGSRRKYNVFIKISQFFAFHVKVLPSRGSNIYVLIFAVYSSSSIILAHHLYNNIIKYLSLQKKYTNLNGTRKKNSLV